ncbi:kinase suppressor of Ras 2-like [Mercenaria mercenaria]|uniref:kinase suppressor of Ras 2-like n=1 Tax=Mercenaria mercenaria TaxID=6596 RepID=UPI00234E598C|nr:kinase suppressor of Ras 2-like [Mercenaria mercenaria]
MVARNHADVVSTNISNDSDKTIVDLSVALKEWDIPYEELIQDDPIGTVRFGTYMYVYRGQWHGDVAIKMLNMDPDTDNAAQLSAFKLEVAMLSKTRHENLVLFMGACMKPPHLAIVTSLCRGSIPFTLLHLLFQFMSRQLTVYIVTFSVSVYVEAAHSLHCYIDYFSLCRGSSQFTLLHFLFMSRHLTVYFMSRQHTVYVITFTVSVYVEATHNLHFYNYCFSLCRGSSLFTLLHVRKEKFQMSKSIIIAQQVSQGMGYLHAKGIVHKDLKTKNIFFDKDKVVITDFGLFNVTKLCHANRHSDRLQIPPGWLCYLSPEIIKSLQAGAAYANTELPFSEMSDVYAFGTVWYELLNGNWPFDRQPPESIIWQDMLLVYWSFNPDDRPSFSQLLKIMERLPRKPFTRSPSHPIHLLSRSADSLHTSWYAYALDTVRLEKYVNNLEIPTLF